MPRKKPPQPPVEWSISGLDLPPSDDLLEAIADLLLDFHESQTATEPPEVSGFDVTPGARQWAAAEDRTA